MGGAATHGRRRIALAVSLPHISTSPLGVPPDIVTLSEDHTIKLQFAIGPPQLNLVLISTSLVSTNPKKGIAVLCLTACMRMRLAFFSKSGEMTRYLCYEILRTIKKDLWERRVLSASRSQVGHG